MNSKCIHFSIINMLQYKIIIECNINLKTDEVLSHVSININTKSEFDKKINILIHL